MKNKNGRYLAKKKKKFPMLWFFLILIALLLIGIVLITNHKEEPQTILGNDVTESKDNNQNTNSIAIPGYEAITLTANSKKQSTALKNPSHNMCLFRISLILEDGTVLWVSDYVKPGEISNNIELSKELEPGAYPNSILKYECFTMDGSRSPLNGAETKLTLWVK